MLGALVEKQLTTPQQYPLTLNALTLACNQSSNRDPVVGWSESVVEDAVTRAKSRGLARFVHPSHGRSVLRYRHELQEHFGIGQEQLALLAVLMLRGPQTIGELRSRTERMARFDDLREVEAELRALAERDEPLVRRLARQPGHKEDRFAHTFTPFEPAPSPAPAATVHSASPVPPASSPAAGPDVELDRLRDDVRALRAEVAALRGELDEFRRSLGG